MKEKLEALKEQALSAISDAADSAALEEIRIKYLGKKGELTAILKMMGSLSAEERPVVGQIANEVRGAIDSALTEKSAILEKAAQDKKLNDEAIDVTMPSKKAKITDSSSDSVIFP